MTYKEVIQMALNYIQPKGYGHCLCGRGESCQYCQYNPERNNIVEALEAALAQPEADEILAEREACASAVAAICGYGDSEDFAQIIRARGNT